MYILIALVTNFNYIWDLKRLQNIVLQLLVTAAVIL